MEHNTSDQISSSQPKNELDTSNPPLADQKSITEEKPVAPIRSKAVNIEEESQKPKDLIAENALDQSESAKDLNEDILSTEQNILQENVKEDTNLNRQNLSDSSKSEVTSKGIFFFDGIFPTVEQNTEPQNNDIENIFYEDLTTEKLTSLSSVQQEGINTTVTVQKCCPEGYMFKTKGCVASNAEFKPEVYMQNTTHYWEWENVKITIRHHDPCKNGR